jgi:hypothetical protein
MPIAEEELLADSRIFRRRSSRSPPRPSEHTAPAWPPAAANAEQIADALANRARIRTGADLRPSCLHVLSLSYARSSLLPNGTPSTLMPTASTSERSAGSSPARSARPGQRTTPSDAPPERRSRCHVHADTDTELGRAPSGLQLGDPRVHRPPDRSASPGQSSRRPATPRAPWQPNPGDL